MGLINKELIMSSLQMLESLALELNKPLEGIEVSAAEHLAQVVLAKLGISSANATADIETAFKSLCDLVTSAHGNQQSETKTVQS